MEKTEKFVNAEVEKTELYSLKELKKKASELRKKLSRDVIFLDPQKEKEREEKEPAITSEFLENLLKEKDRFKYVFKTDKGSVYFVLPSGESWRFKKIGIGFEVQPITTKIFFINAKVKEDLYGETARDIKVKDFEKEIINQKIPTVKLAEGVFPNEFGILGAPEIVFEEGDDYIKIIGVREETREGETITPRFIIGSGWHYGHAVTKIIKN